MNITQKIIFCSLLTLVLDHPPVVAGPGSGDSNLGILPAPVSVIKTQGSFLLNQHAQIVAITPVERHVAFMMNELLRQRYGFGLPVVTQGSEGDIRFVIRRTSEPYEGYELILTPKGIRILASGGPGLFYGMQSLVQLFPLSRSNQYILRCAKILDYPRFPYRGMHLDCGRHFFPVSFIKEYIDLMSRFKINTFHWHLTEDQGWRIQIKKYPLLTKIGSHRSQTVIGHNSGIFDGQEEGGFYTQKQIREVVKYAADRYVTIIPEIEMPGHARAALAAYPWLGCTGFGPNYQVWDQWGVTPDVFCAGKESTFIFLENVLNEVMAFFPSHYIHIGGDECPKDHWKLCPDCQRRMKELGLNTEDQLQSYFVQRIEKFLNAHGRDIIGWDEILEGGLAPNATVMSWRGEQGGIAAAKLHHRVIMTPGNWVYFDHNQGDPDQEPTNIGGYLPLEKVYEYNPVPAELTHDERKYIIGMQGNVWTEYMPDSREVEYMVFPRMLALAEACWTPLAKKNFQDFSRRLPNQLVWLDREGVHFRIPEPQGLTNMVTGQNSVRIDLHPVFPGTRIFYTLDGSSPSQSSREFRYPFTLNLPQGKQINLRCIEITPSGNTSVPYSGLIMHRNFISGPLMPSGDTLPGLRFRTYQEPGTFPQALDSLHPDSTGVLKNMNLRILISRFPMGLCISGWIRLDSGGLYQFDLGSGENADLAVDGQELVQTSGTMGMQIHSGYIPLHSGFHKIRLNLITRPGGGSLILRYGIKGEEIHYPAFSDIYQ